MRTRNPVPSDRMVPNTGSSYELLRAPASRLIPDGVGSRVGLIRKSTLARRGNRWCAAQRRDTQNLQHFQFDRRQQRVLHAVMLRCCTSPCTHSPIAARAAACFPCASFTLPPDDRRREVTTVFRILLFGVAPLILSQIHRYGTDGLRIFARHSVLSLAVKTDHVMPSST